MNQEIEKAIIDQTNKVWEQALKVGISNERERIIKLLDKHEWFEQGEKDEVLGILDGTYQCECIGCKQLIKGETK